MARNTRIKGDHFEDRVYSRLKAAFRERRFGLDPSLATFRRKAAYHSRDRAADIVFDISVEFRPIASNTPFLTIVIECKDYASPVPIDDLEEFKAKLDQCFGKNVKGMFISSNVLQKGALNYARSNGIGVGRIIEGALNMIAYHIGEADIADMVRQEQERFDQEAFDALTDEDHCGTTTSFGLYDSFFVIGNEPIASLSRALSLLRVR